MEICECPRRKWATQCWTFHIVYMLIYHRVAAKSRKAGLDCRLEISDREFSLSSMIQWSSLKQPGRPTLATLPCCRFSGCGAAHCTAPTGGGLLLLHQFRLVGPTQVGLPSSTSGPAVVTGAHHGRKIIHLCNLDMILPLGKIGNGTSS